MSHAGATPADSVGAPLRVRSSIVDALVAAVLRTPDRREELVSDFWDTHTHTPMFGARVTHEGVELIEATFLWQEIEGSDVAEVMVHINSLTDRHREDISPAFLKRCENTGVWHLTYLIPSDLLASYRIVVVAAADAPLPRDLGKTRAGWLQVHQAGIPDPRGGEIIRHPLGHFSSVLVAPDARTHSVWSAGPSLRQGVVREREITGTDGKHRDIWLYAPEGDTRPRKLLVLFDGEVWNAIGIAGALDRWQGPDIAVALISSMGSERRSADLPIPERVVHMVANEVLPVVEDMLGYRYENDDVIVSGQSYGGLASVALIATAPETASTAIAQSASFHYREGQSLSRDEQRPGSLASSMTCNGAQGRVVLSVGIEEGMLRNHALSFMENMQDTALAVTYREVRGGHDYAWWRHGLFWGLDELAARW